MFTYAMKVKSDVEKIVPNTIYSIESATILYLLH